MHLNRNTIEVFDNVGGDLFPFARIEGAQIQKGVVGTQACCVFIQAIAFLGSGRNEAPGIYVGASATTQKASTQEIDNLLLQYTEAQLALVKLEARNDKNHQHLYVHLPDRTVVYDATASEALGEPVWFTLTTTIVGFAQYRARNMVWAYDKWLVGDPQSSNVGYLVQDTGHHWGAQVRWEFGTLIVYNEGNGAIFNELELVSLTGSVAIGTNPQISTSYSLDGKAYSQQQLYQQWARLATTSAWRGFSRVSCATGVSSVSVATVMLTCPLCVLKLRSSHWRSDGNRTIFPQAQSDARSACAFLDRSATDQAV
jgi:hypothetical protein